MLKSFLLIVSFFACTALGAQPKLMLRERRKPLLLQELQLTQRQRIQLQELVRQQKAQEILYNMRLQQILTPAQKEKLRLYIKRKELLDSLDQPKK